MTAITRTVARAHQQSITSQLTEFAAALEEQRGFRIEQLTKLDSATSRGSWVSVDDPRGEVSDALRAAARNALSEIKAAVERIEAGTYGLCEACAAEIPLERLEILPAAGLCMRCAHAREQRGR
ncbi:MAG: TraR/DksA family transcriptional regulator [Jatrophihabitans sp.]